MGFASETNIKSFKLIRGGYGYPLQIYEYKNTKKHGEILCYTEEAYGFSPQRLPVKIEIKDSLKFRKKMFILLDEFKLNDYGVNDKICDGEWFEFKANFSDGENLKSRGYNNFPETYFALIKYLDKLLEFQT